MVEMLDHARRAGARSHAGAAVGRMTTDKLMTCQDDINTLKTLVDRVRPRSPDDVEEAEARMRGLLHELVTDEQARVNFVGTVCSCLSQVRIVHALAESGILPDKGFAEGLQRRVGAKLLPAALEENDLRRVIRDVFDHKEDYVWVSQLDRALWVELVDVVVEEAISHPRRELRAAIVGLAQRAGALGIDEEFNAKLNEVEDYDSPFLDLTLRAHAFVEAERDGNASDARDQFLATVRGCRHIVVYLREHKRQFGTSLHLTRVSRRLRQQLDRLELLVSLVSPRDHGELLDRLIRLIVELVQANEVDASVRHYLRQSADLVLFQITEETAKKGQKYITDTAAGYWKFLRKAIAGGAIVGVFALFKLLLSKLSLSLGGQAALYSLNYAACFVLIYLTNSILATKQPAVTASAIAQKMDAAADDAQAVEGVADVLVLVWRSQFISFVGNLICAFPVALVVVWGLDALLGFSIASPSKAEYLLKSVDPIGAPTLLFAAIAGVYLFIGGVIAGIINNWAVYTELRQRIERHPRLQRYERLRHRLASFVCDHLGMVTGNVMLGVFLGTAGTIGVILGLPFDIRHIAFSSANLGTALAAAPSLMTWQLFATSALGVALIGFVNFLVSFGATLWMTLESRSAGFRQWRSLWSSVWKRVRRSPLEWFVPPSDDTPEPIAN